MSGVVDTIGDVVGGAAGLAADVATGGVLPPVVDAIAGTDISGTVRRNVLPATVGFASGGPVGAAAAVGANEITRSQVQEAEDRIREGIGTAQDFQLAQLADQQRARQESQRIAQPFLNQALDARQQLANFASSPLGQSEQFREAQRVGLQNIRRALASQGSFFSGRLGDAAAQLNLGLLNQEQAARQAALNTLGTGQSLAPSLIGSVQTQPGAFTNLAQLGLLGGQLQAQSAVNRANQQNELLATGLDILNRRQVI